MQTTIFQRLLISALYFNTIKGRLYRSPYLSGNLSVLFIPIQAQEGFAGHPILAVTYHCSIFQYKHRQVVQVTLFQRSLISALYSNTIKGRLCKPLYFSGYLSVLYIPIQAQVGYAGLYFSGNLSVLFIPIQAQEGYEGPLFQR